MVAAVYSGGSVRFFFMLKNFMVVAASARRFVRTETRSAAAGGGRREVSESRNLGAWPCCGLFIVHYLVSVLSGIRISEWLTFDRAV
jgi:hypothetical protein